MDFLGLYSIIGSLYCKIISFRLQLNVLKGSLFVLSFRLLFKLPVVVKY